MPSATSPIGRGGLARHVVRVMRADSVLPALTRRGHARPVASVQRAARQLLQVTDMAGALTDAVQQTVEMVWATLLGLEVERRAAPPNTPDAEPGWAGTVRVSGAWDGEVRVQCSAELAHRAAAILFAIDRAAANVAQAEDALRELANVTGGNLMEVLPGPSQLSMPSVWNGTGAAPQAGGLLLSRLYFECQGEPLSVAVVRTGS